MGYGGTGYATVSVDIVQADVNAIVQGLTGTYGKTLTDLETDLGNYLTANGNGAATYLQWIYSQMGGVLGNLSTIQGYLVGSYTGVFYDGDNTAVQYLQQISNYLNGWTNGALYDGDHSAVQYLNWISQNTSSTAYNTSNTANNASSTAYNTSTTANNTSSISYMLSGYGTGVFYDGDSRAIDYLRYIYQDMGNLQNYLGGYSSGPLTDATYKLESINNNASSIAYNLNYNGNSAAQYLSWMSYNTSSIQNYLYDSSSSQSAASLLADIRTLLQRFTFDEDGRVRTTTT